MIYILQERKIFVVTDPHLDRLPEIEALKVQVCDNPIVVFVSRKGRHGLVYAVVNYERIIQSIVILYGRGEEEVIDIQEESFKATDFAVSRDGRYLFFITTNENIVVHDSQSGIFSGIGHLQVGKLQDVINSKVEQRAEPGVEKEFFILLPPL